MITLLFSREGLPSKDVSIFNFVLARLPAKVTLDLGEWKDDTNIGSSSVFFMGNGLRLPKSLSDALDDSLNIIRELTWNKPEKGRQWSIEELPYQMAPEGIYLIPYAVEPFFPMVMKSVPKWEESIKGKCHKAVFCTVKDEHWNIMRSNEQLYQPPYQITSSPPLLPPSSSPLLTSSPSSSSPLLTASSSSSSLLLTASSSSSTGITGELSSTSSRGITGRLVSQLT